jgi:hypothetical protein
MDACETPLSKPTKLGEEVICQKLSGLTTSLYEKKAVWFCVQSVSNKDKWEAKGRTMLTTASQEQHLTRRLQIRRVRGQPGDHYDLIFLGQQDHIVVPLTEWYRLRKGQGPASTRNTYLACLIPFFTFLTKDGCVWNAPPEGLCQVLIAFHRIV